MAKQFNVCGGYGFTFRGHEDPKGAIYGTYNGTDYICLRPSAAVSLNMLIHTERLIRNNERMIPIDYWQHKSWNNISGLTERIFKECQGVCYKSVTPVLAMK